MRKSIALILAALLCVAGGLSQGVSGMSGLSGLSGVAEAIVPPSALPQLVRWYDASTESGADDSTLSTFTDRSGSAANGAATGTPKLRTNVLAGKNIIRFDGSSKYALTAVSGTTQTVFAVAKRSAGAVRILAGDGALTNFLGINPSIAAVSYQATSVTDIYAGGGDEWAVFIWNRSGSTRAVWQNCVALTRTTSAVTNESFTFSNIGGGASFEFIGDVAEIGIYTRALSDGEHLVLTNYLGRKWFTANLIVCDGNSLTLGTGATLPANSYPSVLHTALGANYIVREYGVGGQTLAQIQADFSTQIAPLGNPLRPRCIYVAWEGANAITSVTAETAITQLHTLCASARAAGFSKIIVVPITAASGQTGEWQTRRTTYNSDVLNPANIGVHWDAVADLTARPELSNPADSTYYFDSIHFKDAGYAIVASEIQAKVQ